MPGVARRLQRRLQLPRLEHRQDTLAERNVIELDPRRRREPGVRQESSRRIVRLDRPPEVYVFGVYTIIVLKHSAIPYRRHGLIIRNANLLALQVFGLLYAGVLSHQDVHVKKSPAHKNRKPDPAIVTL